MNVPARARLVLFVSAGDRDPTVVFEALAGGDVATVILYSGSNDQNQFSDYCESIVPKIQTENVATLVVDDTQTFGRSRADGLMVEKKRSKLKDIIARFSPQNIVGCGGIKDRHTAMVIGELNPDFVFFGKIGGDIRPEPHRKNLALADWWTDLFEIPAILLGGNEVSSVTECVASGAEFVALDAAIFEHPDGAEKGVEIANQLLEESFRAIEQTAS